MQKITMWLTAAVLIAVLGTMPIIAQIQTNGPDAFNFLVGKWDLTWKDNNIDATGKNKIKRILKDHIIKEEFKAQTGPRKNYKYMTWIHYNRKTKTWSQTRVDSNGEYAMFRGRFQNNQRMFVQEFANDSGPNIQQRIVYYNITYEAFDWKWEISNDNGKTWISQWQVHYQRDLQKKKKNKK